MALVLRNLRAAYDRYPVLRGVDLRVEAGEIVALTGRNGAGKSTLLRTIAGFVRADADELSLDGKALAALPPERRFAYGVTLVPQGHRVFGSLSVGENITLASRIRGAHPWTLDEIRERIPIVSERFRQPARTLSGGETQLILVARALAGNGSLMLVDEPFEGLDARAESLVQTLLLDCAARGTSVFVAEQRIDALKPLRARRLHLSDGLARADDAAE